MFTPLYRERLRGVVNARSNIRVPTQPGYQPNESRGRSSQGAQPVRRWHGGRSVRVASMWAPFVQSSRCTRTVQKESAIAPGRQGVREPRGHSRSYAGDSRGTDILPSSRGGGSACTHPQHIPLRPCGNYASFNSASQSRSSASMTEASSVFLAPRYCAPL